MKLHPSRRCAPPPRVDTQHAQGFGNRQHQFRTINTNYASGGCAGLINGPSTLNSVRVLVAGEPALHGGIRCDISVQEETDA